ncbi:MAG: hypothetical protein JXR96_30870, partial [Deltaproteobacteria bacterium]|nr:hypothetical protein [Deltaproteobacteria bacterium]
MRERLAGLCFLILTALGAACEEPVEGAGEQAREILDDGDYQRGLPPGRTGDDPRRASGARAGIEGTDASGAAGLRGEGGGRGAAGGLGGSGGEAGGRGGTAGSGG